MTMHTQMPFVRFLLLAAVLGALVVTTSVQAQVPPPPPPFASYAAKFVCGRQDVDTDVVKGRYATTINVHNPQATIPVQFFKKAVIALPERSPNFGPISRGVQESLPPDFAMGIDCTDIISLFPAGSLPTHIEGFVVIEVPPQGVGAAPVIPLLDVVAKYTARHRTTAVAGSDPVATDVETLEILPITPQQITQ
jgi:hypothetical protein